MKKLLKILMTPWQWYKSQKRLKALAKQDPFIYK
jgi:hypothetical protein